MALTKKQQYIMEAKPIVEQLNRLLERAHNDGVAPNLAILHTPHAVCPNREELGMPRCHYLTLEWAYPSKEINCGDVQRTQFVSSEPIWPDHLKRPSDGK